MPDLCPVPVPTPAQLRVEPNRGRATIVRTRLLALEGELAAIGEDAPSANARTRLRRAAELIRGAAELVGQARLDGLDAPAAVSLPSAVDSAAAIADPDAVLARIPRETDTLSTTAMLARFGLRDSTADIARLERVLLARGWQPTRGTFGVTWWSRPPVVASDPRVAASDRAS